jgi:multiple sugar transport system substrate-binding protein
MTAAAVSSLATILGAACGPLGGGQPAAKSGGASWPAELTWLTWSYDNQWLTPTYDQVAASFAEQHPQTKLTAAGAGGNYREKYTTLVAAGTPPDVADLHHQNLVRNAGPAGLAIDLTPLLRRDPYPRDYVGWEPYAWLRKQYAVPWAIQSTAIFYNKALFDAAGVRYPTETWTWEDFLEAARRLTKPGVDASSSIWGAADQGGRNVGWINAMLNAFGGGVFKKDYSAPLITAPESIAGLEFRASWGPKWKITPDQPGGASGQFNNGNVAMATSGSWFVANVKQNAQSRLMTSQVPWDVAPVPRGGARRAGLTHELGTGIPTGVRNVDASWAALRHVTSPAGLVPFAQIGRTIPPQRSLWKEALPSDGLPPSFKQAFLDVWEQINVDVPFVPRWTEMDTAWQEELDKVWTGERPVRDGAAALSQRLEAHLRQLKGEGLL